MRTLFGCLQQMYDEILFGLPLTKASRNYVALLDPIVASQHLSAGTSKSQTPECLPSAAACTGDPSLDSASHEIRAEPDTAEIVNWPREITLLQLTVVEMIITKTQNPQLEAGIKQKYLDVVGALVREASINTKLIFLLRTPDKMMSHMACKSLASLVHLQLREEGSLNSSWLTFCSETLAGYPSSSSWTAECLWTLTHTVQKILKDESSAKGGKIEKFILPLDGILEGFYHRILSQVSDLPEGIPVSKKYTNNLSGFLDLLELLVASRRRTAVTFTCQRLLFLNVADALGLTTSPVPTFVKKKLIVLLKRCALCKAGEDLVMGKAPPSFLQDPHLDEDRVAFSNAVLQLLDSGWLNQLLLGENDTPFGGGQVRPELAVCSGPDNVLLTSLSLILLKALETGVQKSTSECEAQVLLESVMGPLLSFVKNHQRSPCTPPFEHPCMWLSNLFMEQDDDMFEAAKALLMVYLQFKRFWHKAPFPSCLSDNQIWSASTHRNGFSPHCIFLFLLQSIAFDATVLLDFLISAETCFLEYLVKYLKLLLEDWSHFAHLSGGLKPTASGGLCFPSKDLFCQKKSRQSQVMAESALCDPEGSLPLLTSSKNCSVVQLFDNQTVKHDRPSCLRRSDTTSSLGSVQRLVDYESSEDSEIEETCLADGVQAALNRHACSDMITSTDGLAEILECDLSPTDHEDLTVSSPSWPWVSPNDPVSAGGLLWKSVRCLQELQKSVSRLHRRNLFPYNPTALLKLLTCVDTISRTQI